MKTNRAISLLVFGNAGAQVVTLILQPFLAGFYGPEIYGLYSEFLKVTIFTASLISFKMDILVVKLPSDEVATKHVLLGLFLSATLIAILFLSRWALSDFNPSDGINYAIKLLSCLFLISNLFLAQYCLRLQDFPILSLTKIAQASLFFIFAILSFHLFGRKISWLVASFLLSQLAVLGVYLWRTKKQLSRYLVLDRFLAFKYLSRVKLSVFIFISVIANQGGIIYIIGYIEHHYPLSELGFFTFSLRVLGIPAMVFGLSFADTLYQKVSSAINRKNGDITPDKVMALLFVLFFLGLSSSLAIYILAPCITLILGPEWSGVVVTIRTLVVLCCFQVIAAPAFKYFVAYGYEKFYCSWEVLRFLSLYIFFEFYYHGNIQNFYLVFVGISISAYMFLILCMLLHVKFHQRGLTIGS